MKIEHIAMYVNDLEGARDFFIRYFSPFPAKDISIRGQAFVLTFFPSIRKRGSRS